MIFKRMLFGGLVISMMALAMAGCIGGVVVECDNVLVTYEVDSEDYTIAVFRVSDGEQLASVNVSAPPEEGQVRLSFSQQASGTDLIIKSFDDMGIEQDSAGPFDCSDSSVQFFEPGDDRINRQAYAYAAVYCDVENQRVAVYGIHSDGTGELDNGAGFPALFVPYSDLPAIPSTEQGHVLIGEYENIRGYRLTTGEYQLNVGPDSEGKEYVLTWDGCPQTYVRAAIFNTLTGETTTTEVFPR